MKKETLERFRQLWQMRCICCRKMGVSQPNKTEIHHLNLGGKAGQKRRGDDFTIPLCQYHHQGIRPRWTKTNAEASSLYGPSLKLQSRLFRETFGDDDTLLAMVNKQIGFGSA